jgi:hypothetical protein
MALSCLFWFVKRESLVSDCVRVCKRDHTRCQQANEWGKLNALEITCGARWHHTIRGAPLTISATALYARDSRDSEGETPADDIEQWRHGLITESLLDQNAI